MRVYKNRFTHLEPATGFGAYEGIFINPQSDVINLSDPASAAPFFVGILVRDGVEDCIFEKNKVTGTFGIGIDLETSNRSSVEKNKIKKSGDDGIWSVCHVCNNFRLLHTALSPVRKSGKRNIFMTTAIRGWRGQ